MNQIRLLILLLLCLATVVRAQENPSPYLYYYSEDVDAFVIERADGSDRYTFGQGVVPSDTQSVNSLSWSPSGEWLSWISRGDPYEYSRNFSTPGVMHMDGTRRFEFLDEIVGAGRLSWSPTEDFILVGGSTSGIRSFDYDAPLDFVFYLIDAPNDHIITQFTLHTTSRGLGWPNWTPDGSYASITYTNAETGERFLRKISRTGEITDQASTKLAWFTVSTRNNTWDLHLSDEGSTLIATNLITDRVLEFDAPVANPDDYQILYWNGSGDYVLIMTGPTPQEAYDLWLLSLPNERLEHVSSGVDFRIIEGGRIIYPLWSRDDTMAAFITTEGELYLLQVSPTRLTRLADEIVDVKFVSWFIHGNRFLFSYSERETRRVGMYDADTGEMTDVSDHHFDYLRTSPSLRYTVSRYPSYGLYDETTGELLSLPYGEDYWLPDDVYVNWSANEDWMLLELEGGGTFPPSHMVVSSIDGTISHQLSDVSDAGWLPPRAEAALDHLLTTDNG
jgi:hypothetical protein